MSTADRLLTRVRDALYADERKLRARIERARNGRVDAIEWQRIAADVDRAVAARAARAARKPRVTYPPELPVAQRAADIAQAIRDAPGRHRGGETGSGKTTQLPKICLDAGRGERGLIGHTQPRRIAARAVASRIAQELGTPLGDAVGYKVRFTDQHAARCVRQADDRRHPARRDAGRPRSRRATTRSSSTRRTSAASTSISCSATCKRLLVAAPRPEGRSSRRRRSTPSASRATSRRAAGPAPVITVSGRTYPVEVRYRPLGSGDAEADDEEELEEAIVERRRGPVARQHPATSSCSCPASARSARPRDVLRRCARAASVRERVEILPLFARLSVDEQQRVFAPSRGRRIVLATNVAETSLTVPGIRYVIDSGLARVKRYSVRNKTTLLQIEKIAQASANQRAGRCGRVADGICVRLYGDDDFAARAAHADPEILRSSLAAVILRMASLALGDVAAFPFLDPPSPRAISRRLPAAAGARRRRRGARADAAAAASSRSCRSIRASAASCSPRATPDASPRRSSSPARCRCRIRASGRSSARRQRTRRICSFATSAPISCR